jgi:hypothetical protein
MFNPFFMAVEIFKDKPYWIRLPFWKALHRDCNAGLPVIGNTGKLAKIAIKVYRFIEGKTPVFSVKY